MHGLFRFARPLHGPWLPLLTCLLATTAPAAYATAQEASAGAPTGQAVEVHAGAQAGEHACCGGKAPPGAHTDHTTEVQAGQVAAKPARPADRIDDVPEEFQGVGIDDSRLDQKLPLELGFIDEEDQPVKLSQFFDGEHPVVLTLVYLRCPTICNPLLAYLSQSLAQVDMTMGREFRVLTVSFDPDETRMLTKVTREKMLNLYGRPSARQGWRFLRGRDAEIQQLTAAAGFQYKRVEGTGQFAHPATVIVLTPDGRVARYLPGLPEEIDVQAKNLKLALLEAGEGKIGSAIDWFVLTCHAYDSTRGTYALKAQRLMSLGGLATLLVLGAFLVPRWLRDSARKRRSREA